jgi:hypothetical protein
MGAIKLARRGIIQRVAKDGPTPIVKTGVVRIAETCATLDAIESNAAVRFGCSALACAVSTRPLGSRSNSGNPRRASSSRTRRLTAAWVTFSSWLAPTKLPWRAAASKARKPFSEGRRRMG